MRALTRDSRDWSLWVGVWVLALITGPAPSGPSGSARPCWRATRRRPTLWSSSTALVADTWASGSGRRSPSASSPSPVGALVEGCALRQGGGPGARARRRPDRSRTATRRSGRCSGLARGAGPQYLEMDPDWTASPDDRPAGLRRGAVPRRRRRHRARWGATDPDHRPTHRDRGAGDPAARPATLRPDLRRRRRRRRLPDRVRGRRRRRVRVRPAAGWCCRSAPRWPVT